MLENILDKLYENGIGKIGFSYLGDCLPASLQNFPYAISLVYPLLSAVIDQIEDAPTYAYFHHYRTVNACLDQQALLLSSALQRMGARAFPIAASQSVKKEAETYTGLFQHKTAAALAGLGWIGKSGLLVTPEFGPRVRLATVLTDLALEVSDKRMENGCGSCMRCVQACPAMAMTGENYQPGAPRAAILDARACSEYMKRKFQHIGRGAVCGICMRVCPYGQS